MSPRLTMFALNLALLGGWLGKFLPGSWSDGHLC
jgi:hypothetical protein